MLLRPHLRGRKVSLQALVMSWDDLFLTDLVKRGATATTGVVINTAYPEP
jgi:hypothetical protein